MTTHYYHLSPTTKLAGKLITHFAEVDARNNALMEFLRIYIHGSVGNLQIFGQGKSIELKGDFSTIGWKRIKARGTWKPDQKTLSGAATYGAMAALPIVTRDDDQALSQHLLGHKIVMGRAHDGFCLHYATVLPCVKRRGRPRTGWVISCVGEVKKASPWWPKDAVEITATQAQLMVGEKP